MKQRERKRPPANLCGRIWRCSRWHRSKTGKSRSSESGRLFLLFDRIVAYNVQNGLPVPMIDAAAFYKGLEECFILRDGMYFFSGRVNEYDLICIKHEIEDAVQLGFIVSLADRLPKSALQENPKFLMYYDIASTRV